MVAGVATAVGVFLVLLVVSAVLRKSSTMRSWTSSILKLGSFAWSGSPDEQLLINGESAFIANNDREARIRVGLVVLLRAVLRSSLTIVALLNGVPSAAFVVIAIALYFLRQLAANWIVVAATDVVIDVFLLLFGVACPLCVADLQTHFFGVIAIVLFAVALLLMLVLIKYRYCDVQASPTLLARLSFGVTSAVCVGAAVYSAVTDSARPATALLCVCILIADAVQTTVAMHRFSCDSARLIFMLLIVLATDGGLLFVLFNPARVPSINVADFIGSFIAISFIVVHLTITILSQLSFAVPSTATTTPPSTTTVRHASSSSRTATATAKMPFDAIDPNELSGMQKVGEGSFGVVFRARYRHSDVAVKVVNADAFGDNRDIFTEVATMRGLPTHANVVAYRGACLLPESGRAALVLEFCAGGSLLTRLRDESFEWSVAKQMTVTCGVAAGIAHLHRCSVVHRDIAARNVLLLSVDSVVPKVTDFGMARAAVSDDQSTVTTFGAAAWMAPEQMQSTRSDGRFEFSQASDVFSFAVLLFEVFERAQPWRDKLPVEIRRKVIAGKRLRTHEERYPNRRMLELMDDCWAAEADKRPTMDEVAQRLVSLSNKIKKKKEKKRTTTAASENIYDAELP